MFEILIELMHECAIVKERPAILEAARDVEAKNAFSKSLFGNSGCSNAYIIGGYY